MQDGKRELVSFYEIGHESYVTNYTNSTAVRSFLFVNSSGSDRFGSLQHRPSAVRFSAVQFVSGNFRSVQFFQYGSVRVPSVPFGTVPFGLKTFGPEKIGILTLRNRWSAFTHSVLYCDRYILCTHERKQKIGYLA